MQEQFQKVVSQVSQFLGLGDTEDTPAQGILDGNLPPSISRAKSYFKNHQLSDLLPYVHFDEDEGVFFNKDSHGFILEVGTLLGADERTAEILSGIFTQGLPKGAGVQFMLWTSPNVTPQLKSWCNFRKPDLDSFDKVTGKQNRNKNIYRHLVRRRFEFLKDKSRTSLFDDEYFYIKDYRLFVSVTFPGTEEKANIKMMKNKRKQIMGTLKSANLDSVILTPGGLLSFLDEVLNPLDDETERNPLEWDKGRTISDQAVAGDTNVLVGRDGMAINNSEVRVFSVRTYPVAWPIWGNGELLGDSFQSALRLPGSMLTTVGVVIPDQEMITKKLSAKHIRATQNADSLMAKFMPHMQQQKADYDFVMDKINEGSSIVLVYHQFVMFNEMGDGFNSEQAIKSLFRSKGWTIQSDRYMQVLGFLSALPMSLSEDMQADLKNMGRLNTMLTFTAGNMLPVVAEWKGTETPLFMLFGRRGQIQFVDPYDNDKGNYNIACCAASGAGKSFFTQELVISILGAGGRAWVIDVGRSYMNLCHILDGEFIVFSDEANLNVNPFTNIKLDSENGKDFKEAIRILKPLVGEMARPKQGTNEYEDALIAQAIEHAWRKKGNKATITTIRDWLAEHDDQRGKDLAVMLGAYSKGGIYEKYFEGDCNLNFENDFIVLELEELNQMQDLQSVILMILMFQISENMFLGARDRKKLCILDEAWALMSGSTGTFIETGYRRARKAGGCFMTVTQGVGDYYKTPAATAALDNSDWMFLLRQKKESVEALARSGRLSMDDNMKRMLESVTTTHGKFSEVMIYGPSICSVGRLVVDPFSSLLYSTKAEEYQMIQSLRKQGKTVEEAIESILEMRNREQYH